VDRVYGKPKIRGQSCGIQGLNHGTTVNWGFPSFQTGSFKLYRWLPEPAPFQRDNCTQAIETLDLDERAATAWKWAGEFGESN